VGEEAERAAAEAAAAHRRELAVVDPRLARKVTLGAKATALSDLCDSLRAETGIHLVAGRSVADEKVTIFCRAMPLRDVMRQLSRPFGYTWLRSSTPGAQRLAPDEGERPGVRRQELGVPYRYELVQDLRSQLLEEELRSRDRNAALVALDEELGRFRPYLDLSPDEALARARNATGEEKRRLERYASWGWGPAQIYARLTPADLAALRAGETITFSGAPWEGERELPADLAQGVLQSAREFRLVKSESGYRPARGADAASGVPPAQVPGVRGKIRIQIDQDDLGKIAFVAGSGIAYPGGGHSMQDEWLAVGESPSVRSPENATANRALALDPALVPRVTVTPQPAYRPAPDARPADDDQPPARGYGGSLPAQPMVTTAEVLEALHRTTGLPIVADYYTRLYPAAEFSLKSRPLFEALNDLADRMRLRWSKDGEWLRFRSASYFHDRLKEVPNRLLTRWAASRREHGALTVEDLCEIARLSDAQLDAASMAEGARLLWGLVEWDLPARSSLRPYLRHLAEFTPAQRAQMRSVTGMPFRQMTLAQQQGFLALGLLRGPGANTVSLDELAGASMRVDYAVPQGYEWNPPREAGRPRLPSILPPPVREPTREAALQAARRIDRAATEAQITPTEFALTILYLPAPNAPLHPGGVRATRGGTTNYGIGPSE
jgi:hypothetical protein